MPFPWDNDHGRSREELGRNLSREIGLPVRWIAEGWDCDVLLAETESATERPWYYKVPKREDVVALIVKEASLLRAIGDAGLTLAPSVRTAVGLNDGEPSNTSTTGKTSDGERNLPSSPATAVTNSGSELDRPADPESTLPYPWIAVSEAPGVSLKSLVDDEDDGVSRRGGGTVCPSLATMGDSYGRALRRLHKVSPTEALGPRPKVTLHGVTQLLPEARLALDALSEFPESTVRKLDEALRRSESLKPAKVEPCFVHDDLYPEHVFVDEKSGEVTQLIDWADAGWGDPAADFTVAGWLFGDGFLEPALAAYGEAADPFRDRIYPLALALGLYDIHKGLQGAPNISVAGRKRALRDRIAEGWLERIPPVSPDTDRRPSTQ